MEENGSPEVPFTTKELLAKIDLKLDKIESKLDSKVDREEFYAMIKRLGDLEAGMNPLAKVHDVQFQELSKKVEEQEKKIENLEKDSGQVAAVSVYKKWFLIVAAPAFIGVAYTIIKIYESLANSHP